MKRLLSRLIGRAKPKDSWRCPCCGKVRHEFPAATFPCPWIWSEEKASEFDLTADTCVWRDQDYFIRACLDLPFTDRDDAFQFGVWMTLSRENFHRYQATLRGADASALPPMFGWFSNSLPGYPETVNLKGMAHLRTGGLRPLIELLDSDHPLARQQRDGVTIGEMSAYLHEHLGDCR